MLASMVALTSLLPKSPAAICSRSQGQWPLSSSKSFGRPTQSLGMYPMGSTVVNPFRLNSREPSSRFHFGLGTCPANPPTLADHTRNSNRVNFLLPSTLYLARVVFVIGRQRIPGRKIGHGVKLGPLPILVRRRFVPRLLVDLHRRGDGHAALLELDLPQAPDPHLEGLQGQHAVEAEASDVSKSRESFCVPK